MRLMCLVIKFSFHLWVCFYKKQRGCVFFPGFPRPIPQGPQQQFTVTAYYSNIKAMKGSRKWGEILILNAVREKTQATAKNSQVKKNLRLEI
jgi:hypothetical protein